MIENNTRGTSSTRKVVDIFQDPPAEEILQDSLDDFIARAIEQAISLVGGQEAFEKRLEQVKSALLSRRDNKNRVGNAEPLTEGSFLIATAITIIRENDQKSRSKSRSTPPR